MTTIPVMVRARPDGIADLMAKSHAARQSRTGGNRQPRWWERSANDANGEVPASAAEPKHGYETAAHDARIHEAIDAIAAVILRAEAGLNWLGAEQPRLEEARRALNAVASDARRTAEIVLRLRKS